ncbi:myosin light chain kinase 3 isoform X2 [Heterodontus francisci]|uniref:myosin light chain kinase 3 isoform X2 n=1 Tax=Heterodontus francisci TaxID=7792 RepID=UPI00355BB72D
MSKQVSLATCLAKMYEGSSLDSQNKSGSAGQVKKPSGANQSSVANNLSTMDSKLNLLNEKVDRIVNFQGQVLKKLEDMSQGMGDLEKNIAILKTLKDTDEVVDEKKSDVKCLQNTDCLSHPETKPLFMELFKLVTSVHQDAAKQKEKLDGIEKKVSTMDKTVHFVGETFKNSHIVQFILKGIVPWKKGSLIESSEANNKAEEKGAKPKRGFSNRGVQVQINREVFEGNDCEDIQTYGNVQKCKDECTKADSIILIEPEATFHFEGRISPHQPPETAAKHKDPPGAPMMTNKSGGASRKKISAATRRVKEVPQEIKEYTQSRNSAEDNLNEMTKTNADNEAYKMEGVERSQGKETNKTKLTAMTGAPEVSLAATRSKLDGSTTLLLERASDTIQGMPLSPTEKANPEVITTKELVSATCEGMKEPHKKYNEQQKPKENTQPVILQNTAQNERLSKLSKPSVTHEKVLENIKMQTGQKSEKNAQSSQNKVENKCKSEIVSISKDSKGIQKASKEPEKITEVNDLAKRETDSTKITNKAKENKEPVEKPEDHIIIDDSPPPPAPFSHRIVTTKQILVTSSYTVHYNEVLGGGRFGQVIKCAETSTGLELAAKIIKVKGPKDREDIKNEITVMNQLSHVNLIQLYDAFEAKNNVTLIMEYVGGGELFDRIIDENYNLTELETIIFMKQICEGVQYLHQQYVLHLDLKPENILCVDNKGNQIKIIDFGLARRYKPREKLKVHFGTPEFLAPEVVNYDYVSFPTDMWSVGVITYMLVSGLSPFLGDHDTETMNNIINANWDFDAEGFENVSEEAKEFISNLLVKEKSSRFSAAQCLKHSWLNNLPEKAKKCRVRLRSQVMLRKYIAQRLWKKNYYAVAAVNRLRKLNQQKYA